MDKICCLKQINHTIQSHQAEQNFPPDSLIILLGPTASGKTSLAVDLAKSLDAEIISADSRQIFRGMDIGTGKDLDAYHDIVHHLIDIKNPGEKYNVHQFKEDFFKAFSEIQAKGKRAILCGGTGSYIHSLLISKPFGQIPTNTDFGPKLLAYNKEQLIEKLNSYPAIPNFDVDRNSKKRLIRALEIHDYLDKNPNFVFTEENNVRNYIVFGLDPAVDTRRQNISQRLLERLKSGLIEEVKNLVDMGIGYDQLIFYGLEYKYVAYYLQNTLSYTAFVNKLETEIHRYAKRQMTFFRKMEKDGIQINWLGSC